MAAFIEERNRILRMVEAGQLTAAQAAQLLDTLAPGHAQAGELLRSRTVRIHVTTPGNQRQQINMTATIPLYMMKVSLRMGARLLPQLRNKALADLVQAVETGATGRLLDLQDLEAGERVEIFAE